jgi:hypothetical protein
MSDAPAIPQSDAKTPLQAYLVVILGVAAL